MVLFYSVVHCSLLPFRGRKRVCTCVKLISLKQTVRFIRRASYLLKYCSPPPLLSLRDRLYSSILESRFHDFPSTYFRHFRVRARDTGEMLFSCKIKSYYPSTTLSLIVASSFDPLFRHFGQAIYFFFFLHKLFQTNSKVFPLLHISMYYYFHYYYCASIKISSRTKFNENLNWNWIVSIFEEKRREKKERESR